MRVYELYFPRRTGLKNKWKLAYKRAAKKGSKVVSGHHPYPVSPPTTSIDSIHLYKQIRDRRRHERPQRTHDASAHGRIAGIIGRKNRHTYLSV